MNARGDSKLSAIYGLLNVQPLAAAPSIMPSVPLRFQAWSDYSTTFARLLCEEHCEALRQSISTLSQTPPFQAACSSQEHWQVTVPQWAESSSCGGGGSSSSQAGRLLTATFRVKGGSAQSSQQVSAKRDARLGPPPSSGPTSLRCMRSLSLVLLSCDQASLPALPAAPPVQNRFILAVVAQDAASTSVFVPGQGPTAGVPAGSVQLWLSADAVLQGTATHGSKKRPRDEAQAAAAALGGNQWNMWEIGTATTVLRELLALSALGENADEALLGTLLQGRMPTAATGGSGSNDGKLAFQVDLRRLFVDPSTFERMRASFTAAQFRAIVAAAVPGAAEGRIADTSGGGSAALAGQVDSGASVSPVTLIQGPPGTGKTTTLAGMLNAVHINAYNAYHELLLRGRDKLQQDLQAFREKHDTLEEQPFRPHTPPPSGDQPPHIAPSSDPTEEDLALLEKQGFSPGPKTTAEALGVAEGPGGELPETSQPPPKRGRTTPEAESADSSAHEAPAALTHAAGDVVSGLGSTGSPGTAPCSGHAGSAAAPPPTVEAGGGLMSRLLAERKAMRKSSGLAPRAVSARAPLQGLIDWLGSQHGGGDELLPLVLQGGNAKPRMLVVAHSNTAVDNVLCRILERKFRDAHGTAYTPPLLRVGSSTAPPVLEAGLCLEDSVNKLLRMHSTDVLSALQREGAAVKHYMQEMGRMKQAAHGQLHQELAQLAATQGHAASPQQVKSIGQHVLGAYAGHLLDVSKRIAHAYREQRKWERLLKYHQIVGNTGSNRGRSLRGTERREATDDVRAFLRNIALESAEVVFSTLSSAARGAMGDSVAATGRAFDTVIVDEAGQATEASTLVPLQFGAQQLVLIGDPQQLPATVLSQAAAEAGLERSLFARLVAAGHPVHLLDVQYRMHPAIAGFASQRFYGGRVCDAPSVCGEHRVQAFHQLPLMGPLVMFDVRYGALQSGAGSSSSSYSNAGEATLALQILFGLMDWRGKRPAREGERTDADGQVPIQFSGSVGLFTPYDGQCRLLKAQYAQQLKARQGAPGGSRYPSCKVDISTVDAAQGQERDVVILSTVRASPPAGQGAGRKASIGFLRDTRRMNVALTRAKYALWVVGNISALQSNPDWSAFVQYCSSAGKVLAVLAPVADVLKAKVDGSGKVVQ